MTVYWEYVVIDNMTINSLLLCAAVYTLRLKCNSLRIGFAASIGTFITFVLTVVQIDTFLGVVVKVLTGVLMTFAAAKTQNFRQQILLFLLFAAYTFILGGMIIAFFGFFAVQYTDLVTLNYLLDVPIGLIILGITGFCVLIAILINSLRSVKQTDRFLFDIEFFYCGKWLKLKGFLDSGNTLVDNMTNLPVCFIQDKNLCKIIKEHIASGVVNKQNVVSDLHYVEFLTFAGKGKATVFRGKLKINQKVVDTAIALGGQVKAAGYEILLNAYCI